MQLSGFCACSGDVPIYSWSSSLFLIGRGLLFLWLIFLSDSSILLNLLSVEKFFLNGSLRGTEENKKGLFLFFSCLESSLFLKVSSVWNAPPLNCFTFFTSLLTYPQAYTVWLAVFSPTIAPPRIFWLALLFPCPLCDIPLFLSPPLFPLYYRLCAPASFRELLGPVWASPLNHLLRETETQLLRSELYLKVDKTLFFFCFCDIVLLLWLHVGELYQHRSQAHKPCGLALSVRSRKTCYQHVFLTHRVKEARICWTCNCHLCHGCWWSKPWLIECIFNVLCNSGNVGKQSTMCYESEPPG